MYSPNLVSNDLHFFPELKEFFGSVMSENWWWGQDNTVHEWLNRLSEAFYEEGVQIFISFYDKCLKLFDDYVENVDYWYIL